MGVCDCRIPFARTQCKLPDRSVYYWHRRLSWYAYKWHHFSGKKKNKIQNKIIIQQLRDRLFFNFWIPSIWTGGIGYWFFGDGSTKTRRTYNTYFESCDSDAIPFDVDALKRDLERNLYGQHIVNTTLLAALRSHTRNLYASQKPLVMSFHGTPGTGKNFVADRIVKHFYERQDKSKFVHKYRGRIDFPLASHVDVYRVNTACHSLATPKCPESK